MDSSPTCRGFARFATGITWLSFQPLMLRLVEALRIASPAGTASRHVLETAQQFLPLYLGLDLLIVAAWGAAGLLIALRTFSWLPLGR